MSRTMDILNRQQYQFTRNWFLNRNLSTFREYIHPQWQGTPINYLEIGVFEGMSMVWMLQHVLTHEGSYAVGIDPWLMTTKLDGQVMEEVRQRAVHNVSEGFVANKCKLIRGNSAEVLRKMNSRRGFAGIGKGKVDLCMIDGNHNAYAAYDDAEQCLALMKSGGWILFDDVENDKKKTDHVKQGLEIFLSKYKDHVQLCWKHRYMECYEVK